MAGKVADRKPMAEDDIGWQARRLEKLQGDRASGAIVAAQAMALVAAVQRTSAPTDPYVRAAIEKLQGDVETFYARLERPDPTEEAP